MYKGKSILVYLLVMASMLSYSQNPIVNKFRDSTWFAKGVRFDSAIYLIKGASNGKVLTSDASGRATWQTFSASGVTQQALNDSIARLDSTINAIPTPLLTLTDDSLNISGGNTIELPYIPLSGTEVGKPVTGDISYGVLDGSPKKINYTNADGLEEGIILGGDGSQYNAGVKNGFVTNFLDTSYSFVATGSNGVIIGSFNTNRSTDNWLLENTNDGHKIGFLITNNFSGATGLSGDADYSANITDLDYTQKIYVDQRISDTATQIRSEIADTASSLHTLIDTKVSATGTATLTNKRITARVDSTASSATPAINTDNVDTYKLTAQAVDITSFTTNLSGTPTDDQILHIVIIGTATRAITWGSKFEASTVALPTTTVGTDRLDVYFIWNTNTSKWRCGGVW